MKTSAMLLGCLSVLAPIAAVQGRAAELDLTGKVLVVTLQDGRGHTLRDAAVRTIGDRAFLSGTPVDITNPAKAKYASGVAIPVDRIQELTLFDSVEALQAYHRPSPENEVRVLERKIDGLDERIKTNQEFLARTKAELQQLEASRKPEDRLLKNHREIYDTDKKETERLIAQKAQLKQELEKLKAKERQSPPEK
jgi:hypothetical protein